MISVSALILFASLAHGQTPAPNIYDEVSASGMGKDVRSLLRGKYKQTGQPTFLNGFCFRDGTCQTTVSASTATVSADISASTTALAAADLLRVLKAGDTMTGTLSGTDHILSGMIAASSGVFSGPVIVGSTLTVINANPSSAYVIRFGTTTNSWYMVISTNGAVQIGGLEVQVGGAQLGVYGTKNGVGLASEIIELIGTSTGFFNAVTAAPHISASYEPTSGTPAYPYDRGGELILEGGTRNGGYNGGIAIVTGQGSVGGSATKSVKGRVTIPGNWALGPGSEVGPSTTLEVFGGIKASTITGTMQSPIPQAMVNLSTVTTRFEGVGVATAALSARFDSIGASTAALATAITNIGISTAALGVSTGSLLTNVTSIGVATQTLSVNVAASTTSIMGIITNLGASTATLSASTNSIASAITNIGISSAAMSLSTSSLAGSITSVGVSTRALAISTGTLSVSTAALGTAITNVGIATQTLHTESVLAPRIDLSTVTTWLQTLLSSGPVPNRFIDLSSVTAAIAAVSGGGETNTFGGTKTILGDSFKVGTGSTSFSVTQGSVTTAGRIVAPSFSGVLLPGNVDFSTITTAMNTKLSSGPIPSNFVNLSTITNGHNISTGTLSVGTTNFTPRLNLIWDATYFTGTDTAAANGTFMSLNVASSSLVSSTTFLTVTGGGVYTTPLGASSLDYEIDGGAGAGGSGFSGGGSGAAGGSAGGTCWGTITNPAATYNYVISTGANHGTLAADATANGSTASVTSFGAISVTGGQGGGRVVTPNTSGIPGLGGIGTGCDFTIRGASGGLSQVNANELAGGRGGGNHLGMGAEGGVASVRIASTGTVPGTGGGGGGTSVSVGGAQVGGDGAPGRIKITAKFPAIGPTGATGTTGAAGVNGVSLNGGWTATVPSGQIYLTTATNAVVIQSTLTIQGDAFSIGATTIVVTGGKLGVGTAAPGDFIHVKSTGAGAPAGISIQGGRRWRLEADDNVANSAFYIQDVNQATPSITFTFDGKVALGTTTTGGTLLYYCNGGTLNDQVYRNNNGAGATACTTAGGTITSMGIYVP